MKNLGVRKNEIAILKKALSSNNSELVCVIGRLGVGKTFLINQIYEKQIGFSISGTQNRPLKEQLVPCAQSQKFKNIVSSGLKRISNFSAKERFSKSAIIFFPFVNS